MIPRAYLQAWSVSAPWPDLRQVEQDLIISRTLCDLFNSAALRHKIAFRGGTAIHKLLFPHPLRYSEDIDLVQTQAEPIGATVDAIRSALSWLGQCKSEQAGHSLRLIFRFTPETAAQETLKLKIEINTREHQCVWTELIARIDGAAWKLSDIVIAELRQRRYPNLFADRSAGLLRGIT